MTKRFAFAVAALALSATVMSAQDKAVELGADAGLRIAFGDDDDDRIGDDDDVITVISLPVESFRIGFSVGRKTQLEPKAGLLVRTLDGETLTSYLLELGLLYSLGSDRYPGAYHRAGMYVRPFLGVEGFSNGVSRTNGYLGGGFGVKMPIVSRLSSRFEANVAYLFGDGDAFQLGILAGVSFFTK